MRIRTRTPMNTVTRQHAHKPVRIHPSLHNVVRALIIPIRIEPHAQKEHAQSHGLQDKVRSTIRQFVRDWSEEVRVVSELQALLSNICIYRGNTSGIRVMRRVSMHWNSIMRMFHVRNGMYVLLSGNLG